ncbi:MAG: TIM barrel protein [Bacillota bacterium]|jgi:sugar phosphate isomerase/epimerase|nr:sugar phosphate isomerase/epimerase [Bacillota bacterium]HOB91846.1 TIM barrel protein [Bacillota bacterium]HPZ55044.1 TIM barrel protein [Bacillota bacterium]HQD18989.1 TIM barrel protein [Bacillota bacterium]
MRDEPGEVAVKQVLVSTATLPMAVRRAFYDYEGIFEAYEKLEADGVELVFLPEWDSGRPPVTPTSADWQVTSKIESSEIVDLCVSKGIPIPIVHINRDVGTRISSISKDDVRIGQRILDDNLAAATVAGSEIGVLHLWDTYSKSIDIKTVFDRVHEVSKDYEIKLAIENIPISDPSLTAAAVWERLEEIMPQDYGFTLDLNWCSLYDNFAELAAHIDRIMHVHVQGAVSRPEEGVETMVPRVGQLDILSSLSELCSMGYDRTITLELNRPTGLHDFEAALSMIASRI